MRKCLAALVATAVCSLQAQALAFHVHSVPHHSRGTRHAHAPAIHHHHHSASRNPVQLAADDDTGTTITLLVPAATPFVPAILDAVPAEALSFEFPELTSRMPDVECRSHGPPSSWRPSFRGPPAFLSI